MKASTRLPQHFRDCIALIAAIIFVTFTHCAYGQTWSPLNGPRGGPFQSLNVSSDGKILGVMANTMYIADGVGSAWKTAPDLPAYLRDADFAPNGDIVALQYDGNVHWFSFDGLTFDELGASKPPGYVIPKIITIHDTVLFAMWKGVCITADRGQTWKLISTDAWTDPLQVAFGAESTLVVAAREGVFRSFNCGQSWTRLDTNIASYVYVDRKGRVFARIPWDGYYRYGGNPGERTQLFISRAPDTENLVEDNKGGLFLARRDGLYGSQDDGKSWTKIDSILFDWQLLRTDNEGILLAGTNQDFRYSTNSGSTWQLMDDGLEPSDVQSLCVRANGDILAGTASGGLVRSTDLGNTWQNIHINAYDAIPEISEIGEAKSHTVFVAVGDASLDDAPRGLVGRSTDDGANWTFTSFFGFVNSMRKSREETLYVLTYDYFIGSVSLHVSTDEGLSWQKVHTWSFWGSSKVDMTIGQDGEIIVANSAARGGPWDGQIQRSKTHGATWDTLCSISDVYPNIILRADGDEILWQDQAARLWLTDSLRTISIGYIAGSPRPICRTRLVLPNGNIFVGTADNRIFRSNDMGRTWTDLSSGLPPAFIRSFAVDSTGHILVSFLNAPIYRSNENVLGVRADERRVPQDFSLSQNYPNPFNPSTAVNYDLPVLAKVEIVVYNLLGQHVATLADGIQDVGFHTYSWNASGIPSGVYFCRIHALSVDNSGRQFSEVRKMVLMK